MVRVPRTSFFHKEWKHITGSEHTFYRPIDIALLWLGEVIVRKEFLTVFTVWTYWILLEGLKVRLKCYLDGCVLSESVQWTEAILSSCFAYWFTVTHDSQLLLDHELWIWCQTWVQHLFVTGGLENTPYVLHPSSILLFHVKPILY